MFRSARLRVHEQTAQGCVFRAVLPDQGNISICSGGVRGREGEPRALPAAASTGSTPSMPRSPRPASCGSTTTNTPSRPAPSAARWRSAPTRPDRTAPGRTGHRRACARLRPGGRSRSLALRAGAGPQTGSAEGRRAVRALGPARRPRVGARKLRAAPDGDRRMANPRRRVDRRVACGRGRLRRSADRGRPLRRRDLKSLPGAAIPARR